MAYQGKLTGATIDAQIGRVIDGSVVTENTLHEVTSDDTKPVTGVAVLNIIQYAGRVSDFCCGKLSIIGDSISTYNGYVPSGAYVQYPKGDVVSVNNTYWKILCNLTGASLEVNNSYGGSKVVSGTHPSFYERCVGMGNPDCIIVALGTNDSFDSTPMGDYNYESEIDELSNTEFIPAYIKGIKTLLNTYPNAKIILAAYKMSSRYREAIRTIAKHYSLAFVSVDNYSTLDGTHPDYRGMCSIAKHFMDAELYSQTYDLAADFKENRAIKTTDGKVRINSSIGSASSTIDSDAYTSFGIKVNTGDKWRVVGSTSYDAYRVWAVANERGIITRCAEYKTGGISDIIEIGEGEAYLYYNSLLSDKSRELSIVDSANYLFRLARNNSSTIDKIRSYDYEVGYYDCSKTLLENKIEAAGYGTVKIAVSEGEIYKVWGSNSYAARTWATVDESGKIIRRAGQNDVYNEASPMTVTIEAGEAYLIAQSEDKYSKGVLLISSIAQMSTRLRVEMENKAEQLLATVNNSDLVIKESKNLAEGAETANLTYDGGTGKLFTSSANYGVIIPIDPSVSLTFTIDVAQNTQFWIVESEKKPANNVLASNVVANSALSKYTFNVNQSSRYLYFIFASSSNTEKDAIKETVRCYYGDRWLNPEDEITASQMLSNWHLKSGQHIQNLFTLINRPIVTIIDDDTATPESVAYFVERLNEFNVKGTFAALPFEMEKNWDTMVPLLRGYEDNGHHITIHGYRQNTYYQEAAAGDEQALYDCFADIAKGLRILDKEGFQDIRYWVTPYGITGDAVVKIARKYGLNCAISIGQNMFNDYTGNEGRYAIRRVSFNPTNSTNINMSNLKSVANSAANKNGWMLIGVHAQDWVDAIQGGANAEELRARWNEMMQHLVDKGFVFMTLNEAFKYREAVYRWQEMF